MNSLHKTIHFEMSHSTDRIPFLDTLTILDQKGSINTTVYEKPIDICSLLHALSFHSLIAKGAVSRARTYATEELFRMILN